MEPKSNKTPHFIVRVGISESIYNLHNCERISGGLGSDERYVYRWYEKNHIKEKLMDAWKLSLKFEPVVMKNSPED